jgi:hypothetical protein
MNRKFADRLQEIVEEARQHAPKPVYLALHMVYASYVSGKEFEFARHACRFSEVTVENSVTAISSQPAAPAPRVQ